MAGPTTPQAALAAAQQALANSRYHKIDHFDDRLEERRVDIRDAKNAIQNATSCTSYQAGKCTMGGTPWRVEGPDLDGGILGVGLEIVIDHMGGFIVYVTTF
jgi:hypothetical protein